MSHHHKKHHDRKQCTLPCLPGCTWNCVPFGTNVLYYTSNADLAIKALQILVPGLVDPGSFKVCKDGFIVFKFRSPVVANATVGSPIALPFDSFISAADPFHVPISLTLTLLNGLTLATSPYLIYSTGVINLFAQPNGTEVRVSVTVQGASSPCVTGTVVFSNSMG